MLYNNLKIIVKKFPTLWKILRWFKDSLIALSRSKDVYIMMLLFHLSPKYTYKFSTRKLLPSKENRYSKESKPLMPFNLLESKSSKIPMMEEINLIGLGSSFDLDNLESINGPKFLISFWSPINSDNNDVIISILK